MAVVFISPKQRQKMFFIGITVVFALFIVVTFLGVFISSPSANTSAQVFNKPKVNINMSVFDSPQFQNLQPFTQMQTQYSYTANDKNNQTKSGFISAYSVEDARTILTNMGLQVVELKEAEIGRDNPFVPYYQPVAPPTSTTKTKTTATTTKTTTVKK
jgi:hypothetical protein